MPRCYMVKKGSQRHEGPPPCSPTEASVAPPCYSPAVHSALTEPSAAEYAEIGSRPVSERSAADTEAAHELLSLAHSVPPLPPAAVYTVVPTPEPPIVPIYAYTIQPTNIFIIAEEPPEPIIHTIQTVAIDAPVSFVAYPSNDLIKPTNPDSELESTIELDPIPKIDTDCDGDLQPLTTLRGKAGKYDCNECGKRYATSSNLSRHKQTHRSLDSVAAKRCGECGKPYVSMPALAMHVLTHRMGHVCGVCGKQFSRPWLLRGHLRSHTGEKPYNCSSCGKAFSDRSNLRAHLQTHSTDKNYECTRCHKTFALKSYLNKHQESACVRSDDA